MQIIYNSEMFLTCKIQSQKLKDQYQQKYSIIILIVSKSINYFPEKLFYTLNSYNQNVILLFMAIKIKIFSPF